ncbi:MAG: beta-galactosidase, partial [Bacteroides sp.]|nr:beta-galactosidase [Bacteroides sp.]
LCSCALAWQVPATAACSGRETYNFNSGEELFVGDPEGAAGESFNDETWKPVTLPHSWNEDDAFLLAINKIPKGVAWYRKTFKIPASAAGKKLFLEFEGLRQAGTVYINGREMILHENGVMAFGIDITGIVRFGEEENTIAVRTDNSSRYTEKATGTGFQWNHSTFYVSYGGLNKSVTLHILPPVYQTLPLYTNLKTIGVYIYASQIDIPAVSAVIHAESEVKNETSAPVTLEYAVEITDLDHKPVAEFPGDRITLNSGDTKTLKASRKVDNLHFWSWGYGYLYHVKTILKENGKAIDEVVTRTGFRKTEFGNGVVRLNDRVIHLKGYAQRSTNEWPAIGSSVPAWLSDYSNRLVVEGNGNFIRWMHVTPWKQDVESCDRVGLIHVMPAGDSEKDVEGRQWKHRLELMRDAIIYNRNHPGILFYECGNKGIFYEHMAEMKALRNRYDPSGGRAIGSREMLDVENTEWGGEMLYVNHSARQPMWANEYMRDEGLRKYWDEYSYPYHQEGDGPPYRNEPAPSYNRNQDRLALENIRRWYDYYEARPGTGRRVNAGGAKIIFSDSNTHMRRGGGGELSPQWSGRCHAYP